MDVRKVTVNLPLDQIEFLQKLAEEESVTFTDVLRRSINSERFFVEQQKAKKKILVEEPGQHLREVVRMG